ncbi:MAG: terpene cyclase/mutase family protein [Planctomycetes bacterium]|nr:terpene cyclase/mutase family protein [Planctomycetota bacterium]
MTSPRPLPHAYAIAEKSPWLLTAIMLHAVGIAIASIVYYAHDTAVDDYVPTQIAIRDQTQEPELLQPPKIEDHFDVPKLQDKDLLQNDVLELEPDAVDDAGDEGDPTDASSTSDMVGLPSGDTGGTAIGAGPGWFGKVPSVRPGRGGNGKYSKRFRTKKGTPGSGGDTDGPLRRALVWLRRHQDEDGRWDCANFMKHDRDGEPCSGPGNGVNDVGVTGLALLAFLGDGNTMKIGPHRDVVRKGVAWLVAQQQENGLFGTQSSQAFAYGHAIATVAVCEAYGLSQHRPLQKPAQAALNYIANARNPYGVWRYQPRENDGDTSITGWMVQALLSGKAFELKVDDAALKNAAVFLDSVTDPDTGTAGYTKAGEGSSRNASMLERFPAAKTESLTAVGLLCRYLLGQEPKQNPVMAKAAQTILAKPPAWNPNDGSIDMYYWYYASYALFQHGGKEWDQWSRKLTDAVVKTQRNGGNCDGSWDPLDAWSEDGGRVYSTAMMALCLQAYYRYDRVSFAH